MGSLGIWAFEVAFRQGFGYLDYWVAVEALMGQVVARSAPDPCRLAHTPAGGEVDYFIIIGSDALAAEPNFEP